MTFLNRDVAGMNVLNGLINVFQDSKVYINIINIRESENPIH